MKTFVAIVETVPDYVERREAYRPAHRERLLKMKEEGKVMMGGAWADPVDGALLIFRAESLAEVQRMIEEDPYHQHGLWPAVRIREWNVAIQ